MCHVQLSGKSHDHKNQSNNYPTSSRRTKKYSLLKPQILPKCSSVFSIIVWLHESPGAKAAKNWANPYECQLCSWVQLQFRGHLRHLVFLFIYIGHVTPCLTSKIRKISRKILKPDLDSLVHCGIKPNNQH